MLALLGQNGDCKKLFIESFKIYKFEFMGTQCAIIGADYDG
jgi:hypothetical protein